MSHPALTQLRALRYFTEIPALEPQLLWSKHPFDRGDILRCSR